MSASLFQPAAVFITFREAVEAGVIVSVALAFLRKSNQMHLKSQVFWGAFSGVACAVVLGVVILVAYYRFKSSFFSGSSQHVFEASVMLTACLMITVVSWAMLRMLSMYKKWESRLAGKLDVGGGLDRYALFLMAFTATFREGIEAVVFITGVSQGNPTSIPIPGVLGLLLGALFSYVVFFSGRHVDITPFMYATSALMFAIGAGLLSRGFNGLQTAGYFGVFDPGVVADYSYSPDSYTPDTVPLVPSWANVPLGDFRACCPAAKNSTTFFGLLRSVFGYSDRPTRLEIITYVCYWGYVLLSGCHKWQQGTLFGKTPTQVGDAKGEQEQLQAAADAVEVDHVAGASDGGEGVGDDHQCVEGDLGCACGKYIPAPLGEVVEVKPEEVVAAAPLPARARARELLVAAAARARAAAKSRYAPVAAFGVVALGLVLGLPLGLELQPGPAGRPVVDVTLVISRLAAAPQDGWPAVSVNGQYPGPMVRVPLGSTVRATIVNGHPQNGSTPAQGTAVHWHGQLLVGTPWADGVPGVTQCPVPAVAGANSLVVEFTPDRAGTFWYHGHMDGQYPDGLYGAFVVDDGGAALEAAGAVLPADRSPQAEWTWMVADRYRAPVCYPQCAGAPFPAPGLDGTLLGWFLSPASEGVEPVPDSVVVNGAPSGTLSFAASSAHAATRQLVRIINAAALNRYNFSVDGLAMTVVELDGTPVTPFDVPWLILTIAQRAVVILDWARLHPAVASSPALFFRASAMPMDAATGPRLSTASTLFASGRGAVFNTDWVGTIAFVPGGVPSYATPPGATVPEAAEPNLLQAVSWPPSAAPNATQFVTLTFGFASDALGVNRGYINNASFSLAHTALAVPMLHSFMASSPLQAPTNLSGGAALAGDGVNPLVLPFNRVVELTIENKDLGEHPFHLHGHNFWLVATSDAPAGVGAHFVRRDVVSVPGLGWARLRFVASNPGIWLFHCHIDWHMHVGLATVVVEAPAQVFVRAQTGEYSLPASHGTVCRTWTNGATIPGAGAGFVAAAPVLVGPDNS